MFSSSNIFHLKNVYFHVLGKSKQWYKIGKFIQRKQQGGEKEAENHKLQKRHHLMGKNSASLYHRFCFSELMRKARLTNRALSWMLDRAQFLTVRLSHDEGEIMLLNGDSINFTICCFLQYQQTSMKAHRQCIPEMVCFYLLDVFTIFWLCFGITLRK